MFRQLTRKPCATTNQPIKQTNKQTNKHTNKHTPQQTNKQTKLNDLIDIFSKLYFIFTIKYAEVKMIHFERVR